MSAPAVTTRAMAVLAEKDDPSQRLTFHYNPTTISFSRSVTYQRDPKQATDPDVQFTGAGPTQLTVQLLLDAVGRRDRSDVQAEIDRLASWTTVPDPSRPAGGPKRLLFTWGSLRFNGEHTLEGFLEALKVTIELFDREGRPLRATVDLTLKSAHAEPKGTNPTSGSDRPRRRHVLRGAETLHAVAFRTYGDPGAWRQVAELNGVDDPARLRPGVELLLPDVTELAVVPR